MQKLTLALISAPFLALDPVRKYLEGAVLLLAVGPLHATTAPAFPPELQDQHWTLRRDRDIGVGQGCRGMPSRFPVAGTVARMVATAFVRVLVVSWYYRRTAPVEHDAVRKCRKGGIPGSIRHATHHSSGNPGH